MTDATSVASYFAGDDPLSEDPVEFWLTKQRELVTSTVDYNLSTLTDLISLGDIELAPGYQRRFRWDTARQSRLIESFLINAPVPPVFLNEDDYGKYSVIDGKQRLTAISEYLLGAFPLTGLQIFADVNNLRFHQLPPRLQSILRTRPTMRAVIILRQSDVDIKFEIFRRLNTGGVQLNAQEIRNSAFPGPLNDLILRLSEHPLFHHLLGITNKSRSPLFREMRDAEFVLRFFTFRDNWETFAGGMSRRMDEFMAEHQHSPDSTLTVLEDEFMHALMVISNFFSDHAFQRWEPQHGRWRRQVLAALFDAEMFACREFGIDESSGRSKQTLVRLQALFSDPEFRRAVDAATNTPSYFKERIRTMRSMLQDIVAG